jgi:hypothetical protein
MPWLKHSKQIMELYASPYCTHIEDGCNVNTAP